MVAQLAPLAPRSPRTFRVTVNGFGNLKTARQKLKQNFEMEVVREAFASCCTSVPGRISSNSEWASFESRMLASGLLSDEAGREWLSGVWARVRPFGQSSGPTLSLDMFCAMLREDFAASVGQEPAGRMRESLVQLKGQLESLQDVVHTWDPDARQTEQMIHLTTTLFRDFEESKLAVAAMEEEQRSAFLTSGTGTDGVSSDRAGGTRRGWMGPRAGALDFQDACATQLYRACESARVRGGLTSVDNAGRKRASAFKLADKLGHVKGKSLDVTLGESARGQLVEVVALDCPAGTDADVCFASNCHAAHRELVLSVHFPQWRGTRHAELYYEHHCDAVCLGKMVKRCGPLSHPQPLLAAVLSQTLAALVDLHEQCTVNVEAPLTADNVFLVDGGARVVLGRIAWGAKRARGDRDKDALWQAERECLLVASFGTIVATTLGLDQDPRLLSQHSTLLLPKELCPSSSSSDSEGRYQYVVGRCECEAGLRLAQGQGFRLSLPTSSAGMVWRCVRMADSGTRVAATSSTSSGQISSSSRSAKTKSTTTRVATVENPERLEFRARNPGVARLFLREMEWWQVDDDDEEETKRVAQDLAPANAGASIVCKVSVVAKPDSDEGGVTAVPAALKALVASCAPLRGPSGPQQCHMRVRLRDLKDTVLRRAPAASDDDDDDVRDDLAIHLGR